MAVVRLEYFSVHVCTGICVEIEFGNPGLLEACHQNKGYEATVVRSTYLLYLFLGKIQFNTYSLRPMSILASLKTKRTLLLQLYFAFSFYSAMVH